MQSTFQFTVNDAFLRNNSDQEPRTICTINVQFSAEPQEYLELLQVSKQVVELKKEIVQGLLPLINRAVDALVEYERHERLVNKRPTAS